MTRRGCWRLRAYTILKKSLQDAHASICLSDVSKITCTLVEGWVSDEKSDIWAIEIAIEIEIGFGKT
jgi:hypothetical protein